MLMIVGVVVANGKSRPTRAFGAFVTSGIQCDRRRIFFIWIRGNPLKSPDSTKEIQGNPSYFPWIYLDLLGFPWTNLAGARAVSLRR